MTAKKQTEPVRCSVPGCRRVPEVQRIAGNLWTVKCGRAFHHSLQITRRGRGAAIRAWNIAFADRWAAGHSTAMQQVAEINKELKKSKVKTLRCGDLYGGDTGAP